MLDVCRIVRWTNLSADLVSALAGLEMDDFPHLALDLNRLLPSWTNLSVDWGPRLPIPAAARGPGRMGADVTESSDLSSNQNPPR